MPYSVKLYQSRNAFIQNVAGFEAHAYTAFLYSTKRTLQADAISFSRGVVLKAAAIFCLPVLFGVEIIWFAPFAAELLTFILALSGKKGLLCYPD